MNFPVRLLRHAAVDAEHYRFQYAVIYEPCANELIVVRVVHCASQDHSDFIN